MISNKSNNLQNSMKLTLNRIGHLCRSADRSKWPETMPRRKSSKNAADCAKNPGKGALRVELWRFEVEIRISVPMSCITSFI